MADLQRALAAARELRDMRDPELLLLKGHLALERVLSAAVAARLAAKDDDVPKLKFGSLVDLAFGEGENRRFVLALNDLRNSLAHEFDALETRSFRRAVERLNVPWPDGSLERCIVLEELFLHATEVAMLQLVGFLNPPVGPKDSDDLETLEELEEIEEKTKTRLAAHDAALDRIRAGNWEELIREFRPGWRDR